LIVHTPSRSLLLRVKNPDVIRNLLPRWKNVDYEGHNLAVPHHLDTVRVLRNIGIQAPLPILHHYHFPIAAGRTPFLHQKETAAFCTLYPRLFVLNDPGTAKTVPILWAADYLMNLGAVRKALIVAPLSTLDLVWANEIFGTLMHRTCVVLHGNRERRLELLEQDVDFYIINHHGLAIILKDLAGRTDIDLVVVDECAEYRNAGTSMYDSLAHAIGNRRLWMVTGTPTPKAPTDAWAQARLVNKNSVPEHFAQWKRRTMQQITTHKWIPKTGSYEMAHGVMQPAIRFRKKDVLKDLPPVLYGQRQVQLSKEQQKAYTQMRNEMILEWQGGQIDAVNAADRVGKLRQIALGAVKIPGTDDYTILDHKPRLKVLLEEISHAAAKVIVIVPFKGIIEVLAKEVGEHYTCEVINGDVSKTKRDAIFTRFKMDTDPRVLLCHPQVMAHGLNLTEADLTIFYGPIFSNNLDQQVVERFNRPGQKNNMTILQMGSTRLEWDIYQVVAGQKVGQNTLLDLFRNEVMDIVA
jgi:SNF2 family DNA or RNA helicase